MFLTVPSGGRKGTHTANMQWEQVCVLQDMDPLNPRVRSTQGIPEVSPGLGEGAAVAGRALGLLAPAMGRAGLWGCPFSPGTSSWCRNRVGGLCSMVLAWDLLAPAAAVPFGAIPMAVKLPSHKSSCSCLLGMGCSFRSLQTHIILFYSCYSTASPP